MTSTDSWRIQLAAATQARKHQIEATEIIYWNCSRGLASKLSIVKSIINNFSPKLIFVSEAEIKTTDSLTFFNVKGYELFLPDKPRDNVYRVACYKSRNIEMNKIKNRNWEGLNIIGFENKKCKIVGIYRPFKLEANETQTSRFDDLMEGLWQLKNSGKSIICGGDFNVNWMSNSSMKKKLQEWSEELHLQQRVQGITRYRLVTSMNGIKRAESSCIDHVYSSDILDTGITLIPTAWSDHEIVLASIKLDLPRKMAKSKTKMRVWKNYNQVKIIEGLLGNEQWDVLQNQLMSNLDKICPWRVVRFKSQRGDILDTKIAKIT